MQMLLEGVERDEVESVELASGSKIVHQVTQPLSLLSFGGNSQG